jgi:hypothetical protein
LKTLVAVFTLRTGHAVGTALALRTLRSGRTLRADLAAFALLALRAALDVVLDEEADDVDGQFRFLLCRGDHERAVVQHDGRFLHRVVTLLEDQRGRAGGARRRREIH